MGKIIVWDITQGGKCPKCGGEIHLAYISNYHRDRVTQHTYFCSNGICNIKVKEIKEVWDEKKDKETTISRKTAKGISTALSSPGKGRGTRTQGNVGGGSSSSKS